MQWSDDIMSKKDRIRQDIFKLQSTYQAEKLPKSVCLNFQVRASEAVKNVYKQELSDLCTAMEEVKLKLSNYIKQVILQVTE